jgi:hypothetical protein
MFAASAKTTRQRRVVDHILDEVIRKARVDRHRNRAGAHDAEERRDVRGGVRAEHADALAAANVELRRETIGPPIEFIEAEYLRARLTDVDQRRLGAAGCERGAQVARHGYGTNTILPNTARSSIRRSASRTSASGITRSITGTRVPAAA